MESSTTTVSPGTRILVNNQTNTGLLVSVGTACGALITVSVPPGSHVDILSGTADLKVDINDGSLPGIRLVE